MSHRGFWRAPNEKNGLAAFARTVGAGFGTETDVRDQGGRLVVSHDPASTPALAWDDVLDVFDAAGLSLAVNVKADGLSDLLSRAFEGRDIDWFAFDMSAPEMIRYEKAGLPYFTRHSDIEPEPVLYERAQGVWLDAFTSDWFDEATIRHHLSNGKRVCIVSPELHGRSHHVVWAMLKSIEETEADLMLCTDWPDQAKAYFQ